MISLDDFETPKVNRKLTLNQSYINQWVMGVLQTVLGVILTHGAAVNFGYPGEPGLRFSNLENRSTYVLSTSLVYFCRMWVYIYAEEWRRDYD